MNKCLFLLAVTFAVLLSSCAEQKNEITKGPLEGVWEMQGAIIYKDDEVSDTITMKEWNPTAWQYKVYTKDFMMWMNNRVEADSLTGQDSYPGNGGYAKKYEVIDGKLREFVNAGQDPFDEWINSVIQEGDKYHIAEYDLEYTSESFTQRITDSLGNGWAEWYKRIE
jgi:hypothetical protein